jgi:uncharacterized protein YndB with AHSA1/START domain
MEFMNQVSIQAPADAPVIVISREFEAPVELLFRAHVEPGLVARWVGPGDLETTIDYWDASSGGKWRYVQRRGLEKFAFHGCFHEVLYRQRIVQTFTYEGVPDAVALERITFDSLGFGRSRLVGISGDNTFAGRDAMLAGGMETGVVEGYRQLDEVLASLL